LGSVFGHNALMTLILLALLIAAEPVPPADIARLFTGDDYPIEALMRNEAGTVGIEANVDPEGRVTGCRVTKSSGSTRLDAATCSVIAKRGRFTERASQHGGKPFTISTSVTWDTGPMAIPLIANVNKIIYTVGPDIRCRTESPPWMIMQGACEARQADVEAAIAELARERRLEGFEYVLEMASIPGDHLAGNKIGEARGELLLGRQTVLLTLAADGKVSRCVGGEDSLAGDLASWCGSFVRNEVYEALPADAVNRGERRLTKIQAIYLRPAAPR
jgi:TonB family protein